MLNDHERVWIIERYAERLQDKLRDGAEGDWISHLAILEEIADRIRQIAHLERDA